MRGTSRLSLHFVLGCLLILADLSGVFADGLENEPPTSTPGGASSVTLTSNECAISVGGCFGIWRNSPSMQAKSAVPYYFSPAGVQPDPYVASASVPGVAAGPIDVWNRCRFIDNISPAAAPVSAFVPYNSEVEWTSFIANAPSNVFSLVHCARPSSFVVLPDSNCASPTPSSYTVNLPYGRTGTTLTSSVSFQCVMPGACSEIDPSFCGNPKAWTETASLQYYALDSDTVVAPAQSWSETSVYSPPPLSPNPPPDGLCPAAVDMLVGNNLPIPSLPTIAPFEVTGNGNFGTDGFFNVVNPNPGGPFSGHFLLVDASNLSDVVLNQQNSYVVVTGNNDNINIATTNGMVIVVGSGNTLSITGSGTPITLTGSNNSLAITGAHVAVCSSGNGNILVSDGGGMSIDSVGDNNTSIANGGTSIVVSNGNNDNNTATGGSASINSTGNNVVNSVVGGNLSITSVGNDVTNSGTGGQLQINSQGANISNSGNGGTIQIIANSP